MTPRKSAALVGAAALMAAMAAPVAAQPSVEVVAEGLHAPRGLAIASDGSLFVAEAGQAGDVCPMGEGGFFMGEGAPIGAVLSVPPGGGEPALVASGEQLMALGGLVVADDGSIYVSANTLGPEGGTIVKITP